MFKQAGDAWGRQAGRVYTTCMSLPYLEVYFRLMPIYDPEESLGG